MKLFCLFQIKILKEAIKAIIFGPYTTNFPYKAHKPKERFRGKPDFHPQDCIGCVACTQVCPTAALSYQDKIGKRILTYKMELCIFCGQCQSVCPTQRGIVLSNKFDLAAFELPSVEENIEKELVYCDSCGRLVAPYEQILWLTKRLGNLCYTNPSLIIFSLKEINLSDSKDKEERTKEEVLRADRISILCPRCRRKIAIIS